MDKRKLFCIIFFIEHVCILFFLIFYKINYIHSTLSTLSESTNEKNNPENLIENNNTKKVIRGIRHEKIKQTEDDIMVTSLMAHGKIEDLFYETFTKIDETCTIYKWFGKSLEVGFNMCFMKPYALKIYNCLSYMFCPCNNCEIDEDLSKKFKCKIRIFDPVMKHSQNNEDLTKNIIIYNMALGTTDGNTSNHVKINRLITIRNMFDEVDQVIDLLTFEIEYDDWNTLDTMVKDGSLDNVKQIIFKSQTEAKNTSKLSYLRYIYLWKQLYANGFRQWYCQYTSSCVFRSAWTGKSRYHCMEHYLINTKFSIML